MTTMLKGKGVTGNKNRIPCITIHHYHYTHSSPHHHQFLSLTFIMTITTITIIIMSSFSTSINIRVSISFHQQHVISIPITIFTILSLFYSHHRQVYSIPSSSGRPAFPITSRSTKLPSTGLPSISPSPASHLYSHHLHSLFPSSLFSGCSYFLPPPGRLYSHQQVVRLYSHHHRPLFSTRSARHQVIASPGSSRRHGNADNRFGYVISARPCYTVLLLLSFLYSS